MNPELTFEHWASRMVLLGVRQRVQGDPAMTLF